MATTQNLEGAFGLDSEELWMLQVVAQKKLRHGWEYRWVILLRDMPWNVHALAVALVEKKLVEMQDLNVVKRPAAQVGITEMGESVARLLGLVSGSSRENDEWTW